MQSVCSAHVRRCCSGSYWVDKFEVVNWPYIRGTDLAKARRLGQLDGTWRPPVFERPNWCDTTAGAPFSTHYLLRRPSRSKW
jgi:hypothetical protein